MVNTNYSLGFGGINGFDPFGLQSRSIDDVSSQLNSSLKNKDPKGIQAAFMQLATMPVEAITAVLTGLDPEVMQMMTQAMTQPQQQPGGGPGKAGATSPTGGGGATGGTPDKLFTAIVGQESGGDPSAVNKDSGAIGIGQVLPSNIPSWSKEALGHSITAEEFKNSPELQEKIVKFKLNQYFEEGLKKYNGNEDLAVRYAAAAWYSGGGDNLNSTRPQGGYPSIQAYTMEVLDKFKNA
jgi:hypothetical protein